MRKSVRTLVAVVLAAATMTSCAYYNTFYLARKYYDRATVGEPYAVDKLDGSTTQNLSKSIDYSKKVLSNYPTSKWADDAYLLWARSLLGKDDPLETITMLQDFDTRFPKSSLKADARFYLGVGYRQARKYREAEKALGEFLEMAPKHDLVPYALLERARALTSLERWAEAAGAAGQLVDRYPKSNLRPRALITRAEAAYSQGDYTRARADFQTLGRNALTDEQRLGFLLREADALEASRDYAQELTLLRDALSHEVTPVVVVVVDTAALRRGTSTEQSFTITQSTGGLPPSELANNDRYGRILMRVATAQLLNGQQGEALDNYRKLQEYYPRLPLAAEAQYRIGYAYETVADDFERARTEYARVKEFYSSSPFTPQAAQRLTNLDRVAQFRSAGGDSAEKRAEAGFLLAELYLFQLDKPERALEEYRKVAADFRGTPWEAKALNAQAWVLSRKLDQKAAADSLLWAVVRRHPATEAQLAARDYLERQGQVVPAAWIKEPPRPVAIVDTSLRLTPPPETTPSLEMPPGAIVGQPDTMSSRRLAVTPAPAFIPLPTLADTILVRTLAPVTRDSLALRALGHPPRDSLVLKPFGRVARDSLALRTLGLSARDSLRSRRPARRDTVAIEK